nr:S8 family serine peptidase [Lachnospiraceae bacterium]
MQRVRKLIHIDAVNLQNLTGKDIGVGVLDSGVFLHDDLQGKIAVFKDFTDERNIRPKDETGHGTHVCGIIAGDGKSSAGKYRGIAPGCHLCVGKILDRHGEGNVAMLIRGMEWLLKIAEEYNVRIINISVSSLYFIKEEHKERIFELFEQAYHNGILVVTAAGNSGPAGNTVSKLGDSFFVLCVGCHEGDQSELFQTKCQDCSGRGPGTVVYRKPDIVAPGTEIVSCAMQPRKYVKKSGTSMATPIISGVLALALEKYPQISAQELKRKLIFSADDLGENFLMQGFGMVNVKRLLRY